MQQISLLQPTFVMSVGDLIEAYSLKEDVVKGSGMSSTATSRSSSAVLLRPRQPRPHQQVDGCHLGRAVRQAPYHFVYKNTLFLSLCSENPPDGMGTIDKEQQMGREDG